MLPPSLGQEMGQQTRPNSWPLPVQARQALAHSSHEACCVSLLPCSPQIARHFLSLFHAQVRHARISSFFPLQACMASGHGHFCRPRSSPIAQVKPDWLQACLPQVATTATARLSVSHLAVSFISHCSKSYINLHSSSPRSHASPTAFPSSSVLQSNGTVPSSVPHTVCKSPLYQFPMINGLDTTIASIANLHAHQQCQRDASMQSWTLP